MLRDRHRLHRAQPTAPTRCCCRLFAELGVATQDSDMSMSISLRRVRPRVRRRPRARPGCCRRARRDATRATCAMLRRGRRFHRRAHALLADRRRPPDPARVPAPPATSRRYFEPTSSPRSSPPCGRPRPTQAGDYPARYLFAFLQNHGMLQVTGAPQLVHRRRRVGPLRRAGGQGPDRRRRRRRRCARCAGRPTGVEVRDDADTVEHFDGCRDRHPPRPGAAHARPTPTATERDVLGAIGYTVNPTVLHTDTSVLPRAPRAQASWNYRAADCAARRRRRCRSATT